MGDVKEVITYCRICDPQCGLLLQVDGDHITSVRPDNENPYSQGFMCTKAAAMADIIEDVDRVTTPLKRTGNPGEFIAVSWVQALEDIAVRLKALIKEHGPEGFAVYHGNPPFFSPGAMFALDGLKAALGSPWKYGSNGEDVASMNVATTLLFGSPVLLPKPDLWRTDFVLIIGANPLVSHGSLFSEPKIRDALDSVIARRGRVVVVDPRSTETARRYEHVAILPGTDAWLLLGMLKTICTRNLLDRDFCERHTSGLPQLAQLVERFTVAECAARCEVEAGVIEAIAAAFASTHSAVVYGRTGSCTQRFGTLVNILQLILNVVTGNLECEGGAVFGWGAVDFARFAHSIGIDTYGKVKSRVRRLPDVCGMLPSQALPADITTPGPGQIRSLLMLGANPVLSSGAGGPQLQAALDQLDLFFSLDAYVNETNKHAHYILPVTLPYERWDMPLAVLGSMLRPSLFMTGPAAKPRGEAREEWWILNQLAKRMGLGGAYGAAPLRWLSRAGISLTPRTLIDILIRTGPAGDRFGLRPRGWSLAKLERHPHGVVLRDQLPIRPLEKVLLTQDKRVHLAPPELETELKRLMDYTGPIGFPLKAIGMREVRSHNTWMHNASRLVGARGPRMLVHPATATQAGIIDGAQVHIESPTGEITMAAQLTDRVRPDVIVIPHGWGHAGGWQRANRAGGANSNLLASTRDEDVDSLTGMSILNGIPVRIAPASASELS